MIIILNDGTLVNFTNVSMISKDAILKNFGKCSCYINTLTLYSVGGPKSLIAEEADWNITDNVLRGIIDAAALGESIVDFRKMGLTDGDRLAELKQELEKAYEEFEGISLIYSEQIDYIVQKIQEKKEAIVDIFRMSKDKAEKFLKSDSQYMQCMIERKKRGKRQMQDMLAAECEDDVLKREMGRRGYKVKKGGK